MLAKPGAMTLLELIESSNKLKLSPTLDGRFKLSVWYPFHPEPTWQAILNRSELGALQGTIAELLRDDGQPRGAVT